MYANYHTHTMRCKHARGEDREYIEAAIEAGMKILGFSDHCPWIYQDGYVSGTRMLPEELEEYFHSMTALKSEYEKQITLYIGFESEYLPENMEQQIKILKQYPVDYMILGQHFIQNESNATYTGFPTKDEWMLERYVDLIIEGLSTGMYSYVAHPDLLNFVGPKEIYNFHMRRLCDYFKENNYPVEINMLGFVDDRHYPSSRFLSIAEEVGNTAIVGVDAHCPERLGYLKEQKECRNLGNLYHLPIIKTLPGLGCKIGNKERKIVI